jgi:hypothetical protein
MNNKNYTREELQQYAKENFCLDKLAEEWQEMFHRLIEDKKTNPIVPYEPTIPYKENGSGYLDGDMRIKKKEV